VIAADPLTHPALLLVVGTGLTAMTGAAVAVARLLVSLRDSVRDLKAEVVSMRAERNEDHREREERQHEVDESMRAGDLRMRMLEEAVTELRRDLREFRALLARVARHVGIDE
jgi:predicted Holliday junction resolvase-like endonuclease